MFNNSVSISVSDDESDELAAKMRVRVRRKRKKSGFRAHKNQLLRMIFRLSRWCWWWWWPVLFIPTAVFLVFKVATIGRTSTPAVDSHPVVVTQQRPSVVVPIKNLNRVDPVTKVIGGVRQRCLKLLSAEELEQLDIPIGKESSIPVKKLVYVSDTDTQYVAGNSIRSGQRMEASRFNLFTGNQTLEQREKSFKLGETSTVHCGFYSENGGFKISEEDKTYMNNCKVVVSTCAFGGGDDLYQPIGLSEASSRKVCYVAFWDDITVAAQEAEGHKIGRNGFVGTWRIVIVKDLPFRDQRLNGKIPKMLAHRLFPHARFSIWVDSKSQFRRDPLGVLEALLWRTNSVLAISEHGARSSIYDEARAVVQKNKATPEEVEVQLTQYHGDGLPEDKRFNGKKALAEASVIVREHTALTNLFMCLWFNEVVRFTSRDQLSFPYVLWRLKALKNVNMFPVCTRKDLVNSIGHIRKAKPLNN